MKWIASILFVLLILPGCITKKACERKFPPSETISDSIVIRDSIVIKDSTVIRYEKKDSIVIKESASGKDSVPCNENTKQVIKRGGDTFIVEVKNGKVYFSYDLAGTISRYQSIKEENLQSKTSVRDSKQSNSHSEVKVVVSTVEYIPWWARACIFITIGLLIYLSARYFVFKFI